MQTLRLEKSFPLYGNDITEDLSPFNVGLDRWIKFENRAFVGRDALLRIRDAGVARRWAGLVLDGDAPCAIKDSIHLGSKADSPRIGYVTYSNRGHTVGKTLAMAYLDTAQATVGHRVSIQAAGRFIDAEVVPTPFFDPMGTRVRG
jgi:aminomethyltransferase